MAITWGPQLVNFSKFTDGFAWPWALGAQFITAQLWTQLRHKTTTWLYLSLSSFSLAHETAPDCKVATLGKSWTPIFIISLSLPGFCNFSLFTHVSTVSILFFWAGYTLHLITTLMKYPQRNPGKFGVPLQRFYDFGRPLIYIFALQFLLINQSLLGGAVHTDTYRDLLRFLLNIQQFKVQNCKS